ncbi:MAG: DUF302 domain-containing protein [Mycobacterium sp.]
MSAAHVVTETHQMTRLNISTGIPMEAFLASFEAAAPAFDPQAFAQCSDWDDVVDMMATFAPHGLTIYARLDTRGPTLALSDIRTHAVEYLLGNHVIAETMFRHNPNALLYAPLRVLIYSDEAGEAVFAIDRPSTVFRGLHDKSIAETGKLLDDKVFGLLRAIGVDTSAALVGD